MEPEYITIAQAAKMADRSKTVVRRWVLEGWVELAYAIPGRNGTWLLHRETFEKRLPGLLEEMAKRKGGRGNKSTDAYGNTRTIKEPDGTEA
jgi:hypothetical protein